MRAGVLGGSFEMALVGGAVAGRARVTIVRRNTMGVLHPDDAVCEMPELSPSEAAAANAAIGPAAEAHRHALQAAVALAVVRDALRLVEAELEATQRRLRGIERHRVPALEGALHALSLRLDELEREERVVSRWAERRGREH